MVTIGIGCRHGVCLKHGNGKVQSVAAGTLDSLLPCSQARDCVGASISLSLCQSLLERGGNGCAKEGEGKESGSPHRG